MPKLVNREVGKIGYGLMGLTWRPNPVTQEQAFKAMHASVSLGANSWNAGEIYGTPERNSLHLLNEYFTKYPEDAEKIVLSIKGGCIPGSLTPDGSKKGVQRSIDECLKWLDGKKFLDLFEMARVDRNVPFEETIEAIAEYIKAGKVGGLSLSEVSAQSIRRAHKVHPVAAVEAEFSLWSTDILENGVAETCAELGIPIITYSPLGRGFLSGQIRKHSDIPEGSLLHHMPRFAPDVFDENIKLLHEIEKMGEKKGASPAQVALGWILAQSGKNGMPTFIPIPGATTPERIQENVKPAELDEGDMATISEILKKFPIQGGRYPEAAAPTLAV